MCVVIEVLAFGASLAGISIRASGTVKVALAEFARTSVFIKVSAIGAFTVFGIALIGTIHAFIGGLFVVTVVTLGTTVGSALATAVVTVVANMLAILDSFVFGTFTILNAFALVEVVVINLTTFTHIALCALVLRGAGLAVGSTRFTNTSVVVCACLGSIWIITCRTACDTIHSINIVCSILALFTHTSFVYAL